MILEKMTPEQETRFRERSRQLEQKHLREREERHAMATSKANEKPISPDWLCHCIAEVLEDDMILVNHLISQSSSVASQIDRSKPGTLLACAGGSIMWALGAALGATTGAAA